MRHAPHLKLPPREPSRFRVPANYAAMYLQRRRRARQTVVPPFNSPTDIDGLKLWLEAGVGTLTAWADAPAAGYSWGDYSGSSGYLAYGYTHTIRVVPFKTEDGQRVYSAARLEHAFTDSGVTTFYVINWSWDAVVGVEGYRVFKSDPSSGYSFDYFVDVFGAESLLDTGPGVFSAGTESTPLLTTTAADGQPVVEWQDQSGQENHAIQNSAANSALLVGNVVNGRPVLRFDDGGDGYLTPLVLGTPCTVFVVHAYNSAVATARRAVQGTNNWLLGPYSFVHDFFQGGDFTGGPAVVTSQFVVQATWQDGSASRNWINGAFVGTPRAAGAGPGTVSLGAVGAYPEALDGDVAEIIIYDVALSEAQLAQVWAYLAAKYGLT